jgi:AsmA protein
MNRTLYKLIALAAFLAVAGWLFFAPSVIAGKIKQAIETRTGHTLMVAGGSGITFTPKLGVVLRDVSLAGASAMAEPVVTAPRLLLPMTAMQLLTGRANSDMIVLDDAHIDVAMNSEGHSNVLIETSPALAKTDAKPPVTKPMLIKINAGSFHYSDERNGETFVMPEFSGDFEIGEDGQINANGSTAINGQHANFTASLLSLERAVADGSPLDLTVDGVASSFSYSGRVAMATELNLAGQATLESSDAPRLLNWLGVKLIGLDDLKKVSISGAVETQGPVFLLTKTKIKLDAMNAAGARPSLTAALNFDVLDLNHYKPAKNAGATAVQGWSEKPSSNSDIGALDAQFRLTAKKLVYGHMIADDAILDGTLNDRVAEAAFKSDHVGQGQATLSANYDGREAAAKLGLQLSFTNVEAKDFLPTFTGRNFAAGPLSLTAKLNTAGGSQAAMLSSLTGDVDVRIENGTLVGVDIGGLARAVGKDVITGWNGQVTTPVSGHAAFTIVDGVATLGENQIEAPGVQLSSAGEIDVLRQSLSLSTNPVVKVNGSAAVKLPVRVLIKGPWEKPKISADIEGDDIGKLVKKLIGN